MMKRNCLERIVLAVLLTLFAQSYGYADVALTGTVKHNGNPVCAMVLANGQYRFTCSGDGSFNFDVPLDPQGQITVQAFCSGKAPYRQTIEPSQAAGLSIAMEDAGSDASLDVTATLRATGSNRCKLSGTVKSGEQPICAMVLANGQYGFTCSGDGRFYLDLPIDANGNVTFYAFCSGKQPYKFIYSADDISLGIPYANISIDGDFDDWEAIPVAIEDLSGDTFANGIDLLKSYVARDRDALYFMVETDTDIENLAAPDYGCGFKFKSNNSDLGRECNFNHFLGGWGITIYDTYDGSIGLGTPLMSYPKQFGAVTANRIEFKVMLDDFNAPLSNMNLQVRLHDRAEDSDDWTGAIDLDSIAGD